MSVRAASMITNTESDHEFLSCKDVAQLTGVAASTLRYWASIDTGPPSFRLGGRRVWRKSTLLQWIAEQEAATSTKGPQAS